MRWFRARARVLIGLLCLVGLSSLSAAWSPPVDVSLPAQVSQSPEAAVDLNGNVTAVWSVYNGTNWMIQAATKPLGGCWPSAPNNLSLPGQDATLPQIAIDPMGNATVVWQRSDGSNQVVQASTKMYGGTWQTTPDSLSLTGQDATSPQIAVDPMGNATVVWQRSNGIWQIIQASTKPYGGAWQATPDDIPRILYAQNAYTPQIAVDPMGNATAVWQQSVSSGPIIISASTKVYGGTWQSADRPDGSSSSHSSFNPQIAVDSMGNATVVWQWFDNVSETIIQASTKLYGGAWQTTAPVEVTLVQGKNALSFSKPTNGFALKDFTLTPVK